MAMPEPPLPWPVIARPAAFATVPLPWPIRMPVRLPVMVPPSRLSISWPLRLPTLMPAPFGVPLADTPMIVPAFDKLCSRAPCG